MKRSPLLGILLLPLLSLLLLFSTSSSLTAAGGGYLFVTFKGDAEANEEQIYFLLSQDGFQWEALNGGNPVLVSTVGEKGARDPYLIRGQNGKFHLLATDLSIYSHRDWRRAMQGGSRSILIWESSDLVHWSESGLMNVAPPDAGCAWAPEAIYNPANDQYLIYWASRSRWDKFAKSRIWGAWTKDFQTCSDPFIYVEKADQVSDLDIVRGDDGKYYRFMRDEGTKTVMMEVGESILGDWQPVANSSLGNLKGCLSPTCYLLNPGENGDSGIWCLMLNFPGREGYKPFVTTKLAGGKFTPVAGFTFPFRFSQGSVLPVSAEEYGRLKASFPKGK